MEVYIISFSFSVLIGFFVFSKKLVSLSYCVPLTHLVITVQLLTSKWASFNFLVDHLWPLHLSENGDTLILANTDGQLIHYIMKDNRIADKSLITNYTDWFFCR